MVAPLQNEITNSHKLSNLSELKFAPAWAKLGVKLLSQRKKKQWWWLIFSEHFLHTRHCPKSITSITQQIWAWGHSSMGEHLPKIHKTVGSILSIRSWAWYDMQKLFSSTINNLSHQNNNPAQDEKLKLGEGKQFVQHQWVSEEYRDSMSYLWNSTVINSTIMCSTPRQNCHDRTVRKGTQTGLVGMHF